MEIRTGDGPVISIEIHVSVVRAGPTGGRGQWQLPCAAFGEGLVAMPLPAITEMNEEDTADA